MGELSVSRRTLLRRMAAASTLAITGAFHSSLAFAQDLSQCASTLAAQIIHKGEKHYLLWWAGMTWYVFKPKRYPQSIVRVKNEKELVEAIGYGRENGLKIALRSTGHNPAKSSVREGGMLLDLSQLRDVEIDAQNRTAWVEPGIRAEELLHLTTKQGLAFPAAHTGIVGLGGYLPGGGLGWNMPEYGIACRSILGAEMILADGRKIEVSAKKYPDLHWAIRGSGPGFFAAVTRYKLQLYPLHRFIRMNRYVIPLDKMPEAMKEFKRIGDVCDKRLEIFIKVGRFHPQQASYAERELVCTVGFFAFGDSEEDAANLMLPVVNSKVRELSIVKKENVPMNYERLYAPPETDYSSPNRTAVENIWTDDPGQCLLMLSEKMKKQPPSSPRSFLLVGWSFNSTIKDPSSCVRTEARHYLSWYMIAEQEAHIMPNHQWMDESLDMLKPLTKGHYINEIDPERYPHQVQECFTKEGWKRLAELRKKYDPDGVFHTYLGHS